MAPAHTAGNTERINPWLIAIAVTLSTFMEVPDTTAVATAWRRISFAAESWLFIPAEVQ